ncbi:hypothetical protein HMPREF2873_07160 [Staphylococcus sp. HMSC075H09]|nr:hypothetical protein HMPREF2873_07160 [Staphylococcus sp. HMSC075H09]
MKLYCEKRTYNLKQGNYDVIFDFNTKDDIVKLKELFKIENEINNNFLLELTSINFENYKEITENQWYDIPIKFFEKFKVSTINSAKEEINNSIFLSLIQKNKNPITLKKYKIGFLQYNYPEYNSDKNLTSDEFKKYITLKNNKPYTNFSSSYLNVYNVGCGNCNEIITSSIRIFFDLGVDIKYNKQHINSIIKSINFNQPYNCVLSHWDFDHYKLILELKDKYLINMNTFLAPSKIPNTLSVNKCFDVLKRLKIPYLIIDKTTRLNKRINLSKKYDIFNNIELYRSSDGSNLNQSGIVLVYKGKNKHTILTGDHHYYQIYDYIISPNSNQLNYEIVVPHHGGNAGTLNESLWNNLRLTGCISTKSGRYQNLPHKNNHDYFYNQKKFHCTECKNAHYKTKI